MYDRIETEISQKHLVEVLKAVTEPIVLMGGWAVYYHVNKGYRRITGRNYIGSRDIDLGFHLVDLEKDSAFSITYRKLIDELGFHPVSSSRLLKEVDRETGDVLDFDVAKRKPIFEIFQMYVDLIVDTIPEGFTKKFSFVPIDEPLLIPVFQNPVNRIEIEISGNKLWLPSSEILLGMKMRSHPNRDKDHKRIKDLADIISLILFGEATVPDWNPEDVLRFQSSLDKKDYDIVSQFIGVDRGIIENAILTAFKE